MFTPDRRREVRAELIERARRDDRIAAAAITGSAARDAEDRWSDVDLFLGVADDVAVDEALRAWSDVLHRDFAAVHHFDLRAGAAVYRAFLLPDCLEVDLGFTPAHAFRSLSHGSFRLLFGATAGPLPAASRADAAHLAGLAWHHVVHGRVSIERGAVWQAEYWISAVRDHTVSLACARLGLPAAHAKGADDLPHEITDALGEALVRALDRAELLRALRAATDALLCELDASDAALAGALREPLLEMAGTS
jgi:predicted nucleotidyltransferase